MKSSKEIFISVLICTVFGFMIFYNSYQISLLNKKSSQIDTDISRANYLKTNTVEVISQLSEKISKISEKISQANLLKADATQIVSLKKEIEQNSKIYVYSMDDVLTEIGFLENKKKFEDDVNKLSEEVASAEDKIKNIQNAKVEDDFATVYLASLKLKRNELIENYQKQVEEITDKINKTLEEVAAQKKAPAIFKKSSLALTTSNVEDLSSEIANKINQK